ncbi:hypothetical protein KSP39_PZI021619 [Platanthera zijinensis]|uniref:Nuclear pore complex protein n=1 Tax=Platanthera zijinensis TaxID=2320716 RepID=A0AAP0FW71_9ASPA
MARAASRIVSLDKEIEGDCQATGDFVFSRIGNPVRLKPPHSKSVFDLSNPPLQPLALSERDGLLFLAHSEGFLVAKTKDVIGLAKDAKENGKDTCIEKTKSCVVDVQIGRVSILSLSGDSSMLAATVGGDIHLFFVQSLIDKVQEPAISAPINKFDIVKEFKWRRNSENSFLVLSSNGSLCHGSSALQLKDVTDNVDAVDWSVDGNFVAIARKCTIIILSSNFVEVLVMPLLFRSWTVDSGSEVKVDSIKWVRHDSIVFGCVQLKEDCEDDRYLVQVITSGEYNLTEVSCKPLVFSFTDLFDGLSIDMLPTGVGPYLLSDYLDCWSVAFTSNKKNIDQHISLLRWLVEDNRYEVVSLKLESDKYIPRIDLQDEGDDNLVLGLAVDKISLYEKIKIQRNLEFIELSPRCILLCLTCDGKLTLYHVAWVSEPPDLPKVASSHGDNIANAELCNGSSVESDLCVTTSSLKDELNCSPRKSNISAGDKMGNHGTLDVVEPCSRPGPGIITSSYSRGPAIEEPHALSKAGDLGTNSTMYERASDSLAVEVSATGKTLGSTINVESSFGSRIAQKPIVFSGSNSSVTSTTKEAVASQYSSLGSTITVESSFGSRIAQKPIGLSGSNSSASCTTKETVTSQYNSPPDIPTFSKPNGTLVSSEKSCQSGLNVSIKSGYPGSSSILNSSSVAASAKLPGSRQQLLLANSTSSKPRHILESEAQFSKQFYNVKEVTKELDDLLSSIEGEGGFKDLCTVFQEQSLLALEASLDVLSEVSFIYRNKVENQLMEIQLLHNKMLEVSARQVYVECIVQQASDHKYWDIWNSQKLSLEFEAKRLRISDLMQNLTNQLIELKRHFNSLEINRFGEFDTKPTGWRAPSHSRAPSRRTPSLHSVYGTVNSQLAAAEQLSECLSKQMAVLNIRPPTSEKRKFTKELFESIGLDPKMDAFMSPELNCSKLEPNSARRSSFSSTSLKDHSRKSAPTSVKSFESARKKDSLDKNWAHFEPSRTTIKRTSKNEQVRSSLDVTFREAKEVFDTQVKAFDKTRMSNFSGVSSKPFSITKRTSDGATSSPSKTTFSYSQPLQHSPSVQEKSSKQVSDDQSKSLFKWAKDPSDLPAEPNISSTSHYSQMFQSAATSSKKDEKLGSPFMFDAVTSSPLNQSSIHVTKMALTSKQSTVSTHRKFSDTVSPRKIASAAERSQLNQETGQKNEVAILANFTQASTKNSVVPSTTLSASMLQSVASFSSSSPSFQFAKTALPNNFLSPNNSNTSSSFSNEISFKSVPFLTSARASEVSLSSNKIGSELKRATQVSELNSDTSQVSARFNTTKTDDTNDSKLQQVTSQTLATSNLFSTPPSTTINSMFPAVSDILVEAESIREVSSSIMTTEKDDSLEPNLSQEDEMEEEALENNSILNFESLGGLSVQSTPTSNVLKPNPFVSSFVPVSTGSTSPLLSWNATPGQLFRPPSFNLPVSQPSQSAGSTSLIGVSGGFSGFGQPAQVGAGQQALGSVLGSFGQSRQLGAGMPGFGFAPSGIPSAGSGSGFANTGGFAGAATGGGFAGLAPNTGGFAGAAAFGGGFAGASSAGGGFAGAASAGGGFTGAASPGGGFAGVASASSVFGGAGFGGGFSSGGFGGFSNRPPAELLTQMRK